MNLTAIPNGERVLIDANVLIYARRGTSAQCQGLLSRCVKRDVVGVVTSIAIAEFCHRRMMQEAQSRGLSASNPAKALGQNPSLIRQLSQYAQDVEDLLAGDFAILDIAPADFATALQVQRQYGLLTNDSLNLAVMQRASITAFATADAQFDAVSGISVYKPDDL